MNRQRPRNKWLRAGTAAALGVATSLLAGCPSDKPPDNPGGMADMAMEEVVPPLGSALAAKAATTSGGYLRPLDAVPSGDAATFYFTAMGTGGMGVFRVPAGGGAAAPVVVGAPFVGPFGLGISSDDKTLFVADVAAGLDPSDPAGMGAVGQIYTLAAAGGTPAVLAGTAGTRPRALDVVKEGGVDVIYYSGVLNDKPGLLKIAATGGSAAAIATGGAFTDPSGVAAAKNGDVYVVNTVSSASGTASIIKVAGGVASEVLSGISVGYPAGLALSRDEKTLLISGNDSGKSVVITVNLATKAITPQSMGLLDSVDSGGLHRARNTDVFAWCGVTAGTSGTVFNVTFK
jgi:sugar lactone lactonase YvrE